MIAATACAACSHSANPATITRAHSGLRQQLHRDLGDYTEHALRSGHERQQVEARAVERFAADLEHLALDGGDTQAQDVVNRQPILEAMHAAGVLGNVAADAACDLAGRIGRVVQAVRARRLRDGEITHAGLHTSSARERIEREDAIQLAQHEQQPFLVRSRTARQARARAARHDWHARLVTQREDSADLRFGLRQSDQAWLPAKDREPVALERAQLFRARQEGFVGQQLAKLSDQPGEVTDRARWSAGLQCRGCASTL